MPIDKGLKWNTASRDSFMTRIRMLRCYKVMVYLQILRLWNNENARLLVYNISLSNPTALVLCTAQGTLESQPQGDKQ